MSDAHASAPDTVLGNGLIHAQATNYPVSYGRFAEGYFWAANWIVTNSYDTQGPCGYRFRTNINPSNQTVPSTNGKSTDHNIDTYAFFRMLAALTNVNASNGTSWSVNAKHELLFVEAMFNSARGFFFPGTNADQITISTGIIPEDVQTWSYLALQDKSYGVSIDWVKTNLVTIDTPSSPL